MRRKCPRVGDIVRSETLPALGPGYVEKCEGIHLYVRWLRLTPKVFGGLSYLRRDSVEVASSANSN